MSQSLAQLGKMKLQKSEFARVRGENGQTAKTIELTLTILVIVLVPLCLSATVKPPPPAANKMDEKTCEVGI